MDKTCLVFVAEVLPVFVLVVAAGVVSVLVPFLSVSVSSPVSVLE